MDPALFPLLGALIGASAGVGGAWLAGRRQARLEVEKWQRGLKDAFANDLRSAVKELTTELAKAAHSMCWLCWLAKRGPSRLTQDRIDQYDEEMHKLLPHIAGLHAVIAGMDQKVYNNLAPVVARVNELDAAIGAAGLGFIPDKSESAMALAGCHEESIALERELPRVVAQAIAGYATSLSELKTQ